MNAKAPKYSGRTRDLTLTWLTETFGFEWEQWRSLAAEWISQQDTGINIKLSSLVLFFEKYLVEHVPWASRIYVFFEGHQGRCCSSEEFKGVVLKNTKRSDDANLSIAINYISEFIDWVLDSHFSEPNDNNIVVRLWKNPFHKVTRKGRYTETVRTPLPYRYIQDLRCILCPNYEGNFQDWKWAQQTKTDRDWFEVPADIIDPNDPDCVYKTKEVFRTIKGEGRKTITVYHLWSPVRAMVLFVKLHLPLRTFQVRMLDSGEADTYNYDNGQWVENIDHVLALGSPKHPYERGFFRRIFDNITGNNSTGLFVNTNKTADKNKDEIDRGYVIPWEHKEVIYWCQKLCSWQSKYNSIKKLVDGIDLLPKHFGCLKSSKQLKAMGSFCFLFRDAAARKKEDRNKPIISGISEVLWYELLAEQESRLLAEGTTLSNGQPLKLVYDCGKNQKTRTATLFPLHSLRVSLITAYAMDGHVPIPVIAKLLAGHTRLITTLYYVKITPSVMTKKMSEAQKRVNAHEKQSLKAFLLDADEKQIQKQIAFFNQEAVMTALNTRNPVGWVNLHIGLCLQGRNTTISNETPLIGGCWNGGSLIKDVSDANRRIYSPVPHGPENCVRCRWYLTDARYLPQLEAHLNFISYRAAEAANLAVSLEAEIDALNEKKYTAEGRNQPFIYQDELEALHRRFEKQTVEANLYTEDWIACFNLITRIREIELNRNTNDITNKLVAAGSEEDLQICVTETDSKLLQLALVCDDAEYYPDLKDDVKKTGAIAERTIAISRYMKREGYQPALLLMDEETQLIAVNAMLRQMAMMMDKDNKLEGFRKAVNYLEMEQYMIDEGLLKQGINALSAYCRQPILRLVNGELIDINEDKGHVH